MVARLLETRRRGTIPTSKTGTVMIKRKTILTSIGGIALLAIGYTAGAADAPTPKGYIVAEVTVTDAEEMKPYAAATTPIISKFGGHYIVRGGKSASLEGAAPAPRIAMMEFPSFAAAQAYYSSPDYSAIKTLRQKAATSRLFLVEGTPPTP